jgi:hypothetical protein
MARHKITKLPILFLLLCIFSASASCQQQRRPCRYLIPEGYVGWVKIYFEIPNAPLLPIEDGHYLFKIPPTGVLKISSKFEGGVASDDYYYVSGDKRTKLESTGWDGGGMIWAGNNGVGGDDVDGGAAVYEGFFVGTEEQLKKYGFQMKEKVGPIKTDGEN